MRGHIRRRRNGWQVQVSLGTDPTTGRRRFTSRQVNGTRREAEQLLAELVAQASTTAAPMAPKGITVGRLLDEWLAVGQLEPSTAYQARQRLDRYVRPRLGAKRLAKLGTIDLDRLYVDLHRAGGAAGQPLAPSTVRRVHTDVSSALSQAVRWGWIRANPASTATLPKIRKRRPKAPRPAEVRALLGLALDHDPPLVVYLRLAAITGARRGELCALRWSDITWQDDEEPGSVRIERAVGVAVGGIYLKGTKADDDRPDIALDDTTVALLVRHRRDTAARALAHAGDTLHDGAFVFSFLPDGSRPWSPSTVTHHFEALRARAGLGHVELRQLRHFVGTQLAGAGVATVTISNRLGHARTSTTQDFYTAWLPEPDRQAAQLLGRLLGDSATGGR